jgi:hypothetical protein
VSFRTSCAAGRHIRIGIAWAIAAGRFCFQILGKHQKYLYISCVSGQMVAPVKTRVRCSREWSSHTIYFALPSPPCSLALMPKRREHSISAIRCLLMPDVSTGPLAWSWLQTWVTDLAQPLIHPVWIQPDSPDPDLCLARDWASGAAGLGQTKAQHFLLAECKRAFYSKPT